MLGGMGRGGAALLSGGRGGVNAAAAASSAGKGGWTGLRAASVAAVLVCETLAAANARATPATRTQHQTLHALGRVSFGSEQEAKSKPRR